MLKKNRFLVVLIILCMTISLFGCSRTNVGRTQGDTGTTDQGISLNNTTGAGTDITGDANGGNTNQGTTSGTTPGAIGGGTTGGTTGNTGGATGGINGGPVGTTTGGGVATNPPPVELVTLEDDAVRIMAAVNAGNWSEASKTMSSTLKKIGTVRKALSSAGVPNNVINNIVVSINKLNSAIRAKKSYEAKQWANTTTRYLSDALSAYRQTVPADMTRLNHYIRQVQLDIEKKNWTKAKENQGMVNSVWKGLRLQLNRNSANVKNMDKTVSALSKDVGSKKASSSITHSKNALYYSTKVRNEFKTKGRRP